MCNQAGIDTINSAPCCFPNWANFGCIEKQPTVSTLHCFCILSCFASSRMFPANSHTRFKDCPTKMNTKSKRCTSGNVSAWRACGNGCHSENLACLFSASSWQHCSNMAQEGFTSGDCLFNHKLFSSIIRQLEKNRKLKCCIWCFFILQIFCVCKCCFKLEVFWPFQAM